MHSLFSSHLSWTLNKLGYSQSQRKYRQDAYREMDGCVDSAKFKDLTVGSKGEGITCFYESDRDNIIIDKNVVCLEDPSMARYFTDKTVFTMNTNFCYPGHTLLILENLGNIVDDDVYRAIVSLGGKFVLSSDRFTNNNSERQKANFGTILECHELAGPATPVSLNGMDIDNVWSFRCFCPNILHQWSTRQRPYNWPSYDLRERVSSLDAFVVASGFSESDNRHLEWRICFNKGEICLMNSLNDCQIKLYIVLKMIVKEILKPKKKEISSFVVKNIVFWLAELYPQDSFQENNLYDWITKALFMLKRSINVNCVPYFMIPGRNLLAGKMQPHLQARLQRRLGKVLSEGPRSLLRCQKLNTGMLLLSPLELGAFGQARDELEMLNIIYFNRCLSLRHQGITDCSGDELTVVTVERMLQLVNQICDIHAAYRLSDCEPFRDVVAKILS